MRISLALVVPMLLTCYGDTVAPAKAPFTLPTDFSVEKNISYSSYPETVLDLYQPRERTGARRPAVVLIHGGGWVSGDKEDTVRRWLLPWLDKGFVVANVNYRLAKSAKAPAAVADALTAVAWMEGNAKRYNVDPKKIVVTGTSAGGHLALMAGLATKSAHVGPLTKVAAVINFCGITDVEDLLQGANKRDFALEWIPTGKQSLEIGREVSPVAYVRKDAPPILTIQGTDDETVPYEQGVELTRQLRRVGADAELIPLIDGKHQFTDEELAQSFPQVFEFLRKRGMIH